MIYTGMRAPPRYPPFYGAADPYREGPGSPAAGREDLYRDLPRGDEGFVATAGLGALVPTRLGQLDGSLSPTAYTLASLVGAGVGGALVGYVASEKREGTIRGAVFSAGLAAVSDAVLFFTTARPGAGVLVGTAGLGALGWTLYELRR